MNGKEKPWRHLVIGNPPTALLLPVWHAQVKDFDAASYAACYFAGLSEEAVVEMGEAVTGDWFGELKFSSLFKDDK